MFVAKVLDGERDIHIRRDTDTFRFRDIRHELARETGSAARFTLLQGQSEGGLYEYPN